FHAEDSIRYRIVTAVQTCALPILTPDKAHLSEPRIPSPSRVVTFAPKLLRYIKTLIANVICEGSGRVVDQVLYVPTASAVGRIRPRGVSVASPGPGTLLALHVPVAPEAVSLWVARQDPGLHVGSDSTPGGHAEGGAAGSQLPVARVRQCRYTTAGIGLRRVGGSASPKRWMRR